MDWPFYPYPTPFHDKEVKSEDVPPLLKTTTFMSINVKKLPMHKNPRLDNESGLARMRSVTRRTRLGKSKVETTSFAMFFQELKYE